MEEQIMISSFDEEKVCVYKEETYSVRDNGAIMRHALEGKRVRKLDTIWTLGNKNKEKGYMQWGGVPIHRIVAVAFHGYPPEPGYVVDHIDTNRCNNRPENLRWVTKLENALNNPITRRRIILSCGSIENFLKNPSLLQATGNKNFDWMRTVSKEEAVISKERLEDWAKSDKEPTGKGQLGNWVYQNRVRMEKEYNEEEKEIEAANDNCSQIGYGKTPLSFVLAPVQIKTDAIDEYFANLRRGAVFAKNGSREIVLESIAKKENLFPFDTKGILVLGKDVKNNVYNLVPIIYKDGIFIHELWDEFTSLYELSRFCGIELGEDSEELFSVTQLGLKDL